MSTPSSWQTVALEELAAPEARAIVDGPFGSALKSDHYSQSGIRVIRLNNLGDRKFIAQDAAYVPDGRFGELAAHEALAGDLVTASLGDPIGRTCMVPEGLGRAIVKADCFRTRLSSEIDAAFVLYMMNAPQAREQFSAQGRGVGRVRINLSILRSLALPLPPLAEQRRIVAKLDALTARLARARAELDRVPVLAEHLRRSVLSRAFSGALTGEGVTTGFPERWRVQPLGEISEIQGGIQVGKKRPVDVFLHEVPYLRVANVQRGWLNLKEIKRLGVTDVERDRLTLRDGDILMNEGGDRDKLGRGWVWREQVQGCIHQNHVFRIRLSDPEFPPEFVSHYANEFGQAYFIDQGTQTTNLASISKRKVAALPVPIPPADEAREIVNLITDAFARADRMEAEAARARALIDRLEAALLAKAFRGELVPQDPADEPASALLTRIRANRAAAPKPKRGRKEKTTAHA